MSFNGVLDLTSVAFFFWFDGKVIMADGGSSNEDLAIDRFSTALHTWGRSTWGLTINRRIYGLKIV